jgi:hypothetical protein
MKNSKNTSRDLFSGALEMMDLESLRRQPAHGYALVQHIQQRSNNLLQVEEGSLYPALQRLLKTKMVKAEWTVSPHDESLRPVLRGRFRYRTKQGPPRWGGYVTLKLCQSSMA